MRYAPHYQERPRPELHLSRLLVMRSTRHLAWLGPHQKKKRLDFQTHPGLQSWIFITDHATWTMFLLLSPPLFQKATPSMFSHKPQFSSQSFIATSSRLYTWPSSSQFEPVSQYPYPMSNPRLHPDQILKRLPRFTSALVVFFNAKQIPAPSLTFWHSPHQLPFPPPKKRTGRRKGRVRNVLESHLELSKEHSIRGREPQCVVRDCGWAACTQQGMR